MVKITNDLLMVADSGLLTILVIDLSSAFDTISHNILLERLAAFGIIGISVTWFESYLSGSTQIVQIKKKKYRSQYCPVIIVVPHGSVLGPLQFISYLLPLGNIFWKFGIQFHGYADDTQLYRPTKLNSTLSSTSLCDCLMEIKC